MYILNFVIIFISFLIAFPKIILRIKIHRLIFIIHIKNNVTQPILRSTVEVFRINNTAIKKIKKVFFYYYFLLKVGYKFCDMTFIVIS